MSWTICDIHGPVAEPTGPGATTAGAWSHSGSQRLSIVNGTPAEIILQDAAQTLASIGLSGSAPVGTTIYPGAGGVIDGVPDDMPWCMRLEKCLYICETTDGPCIAVLDAPATREITGALSALAIQYARINALHGTEKLLILSGLQTKHYPIVEDCSVIYSTQPWSDLCSKAQWGMRVTFPDHALSPYRMLDAFGLLLGSKCMPSGPHTSTALYPDGTSLPSEVLTYMAFSDNVTPGSARASTTRGMSATTTDGMPWTATIILRHDEEANEDSMMYHMRRLLTADTAEQVGASYFALSKLGTTLPPFVRRAMSDVHTNTTANMQAFVPSTMCRVASHHNHSIWS